MSTPLLLLLACARPVDHSPERPPASLEQGLARATDWVHPTVALETLDGLMQELPADCPTVVFADGPGLRESWSACAQDRARGSVDRYEDGQMAWMDITGLSLLDEQLEGAISQRVSGDLSTLDWAGTHCSPEDGCTQLDLTWTLVERPSERALTDALVSGTLYTPALGPVLVEGTFTLSAECEHPTGGLLLLEAEHTHTLAFDEQCGSCPQWHMDGQALGELCF